MQTFWKVKIIKEHYALDFEKKLSDFLNSSEIKKIVDIEYSTIHKSDSMYSTTYTALIIYE